MVGSIKETALRAGTGCGFAGRPPLGQSLAKILIAISIAKTIVPSVAVAFFPPPSSGYVGRVGNWSGAGTVTGLSSGVICWLANGGMASASGMDFEWWE